MNRAERAERDAKILKMIREGFTFARIAETFLLSESGVRSIGKRYGLLVPRPYQKRTRPPDDSARAPIAQSPTGHKPSAFISSDDPIQRVSDHIGMACNSMLEAIRELSAAAKLTAGDLHRAITDARDDLSKVGRQLADAARHPAFPLPKRRHRRVLDDETD